MQLYPFLSPDDAGSDEEKRFTESEIQQLLSEKLAEEKQRYETALQTKPPPACRPKLPCTSAKANCAPTRCVRKPRKNSKAASCPQR